MDEWAAAVEDWRFLKGTGPVLHSAKDSTAVKAVAAVVKAEKLTGIY